MAENRPAADGLFHLALEVERTPLDGSHKAPGQYVKLASRGAEGTFAIASPPGAARFEFLVKQGSAVGSALCACAAGSAVQVSGVSGKGFPLERARGRDALLIATGSGAGAIRSAVEVIRRERNAYGRVTLLLGARTPSSFAYRDEMGGWEKDGIRLLCTVSRPEFDYRGLRGYVQAHLLGLELSGAVAFLVGQKEMVREVTAALEQRGLSKEEVFLNY